MIDNYLCETQLMMQAISREQIDRVMQMIRQAYIDSHHIFIMGNGGSAATASHFALDLAKNTTTRGIPKMKVTALTDNVPLITAWANDAAYEHIFERQLEGVMRLGDVVVGISTSGNSQNVINAFRYAAKNGAFTIAFLGADGGQVKSMVDAYVLAPGSCIEQEEDAHLIIAHIITQYMRAVLKGHKYAQA